MLSLRKIKNNKKSYIFVILGIIILATAGVFYWFNQNRPNTPVTPSSPADNSAGTKEKDSSASTSIGNLKDEEEEKDVTPPQIDDSVTPQSPVGTFVSNHRPNLDGQPAPNTIESTCTTTAGALCTISFTNGEKVLSLPTQQANQNGNTSWTWKLQDIGITEGSWSITATAKNGTKSEFATDPMNLEVAP